jgi:GNAT superfamily N-acetyltransferase
VTTIRPATPADVPNIHALICELAEFEREPNAVTATVADLHDALFVGSHALGNAPVVHALVIDDDKRPSELAAMALYVVNYSTWLGRHGIYLEDLYVRQHVRGRGHGGALLAGLAQVAVEHGYGRLEWSVLDWNTPAWDFYASRGATALTDWTVHRVTGPELVALAAQWQVEQGIGRVSDQQSEAGTS